MKNRGVQDILIACKDGLSGFSEAINAAFPRTEIQLCIIHQIRNSMKYVPYKNQKGLIADLKKVYQALTIEEAKEFFYRLQRKMGQEASHHCPVLGEQLAGINSLLQVPIRNSPDDLHN
ncbi:MAG: transposase [Desulfotomaculaceae bacterium]|nr:transposase [Desulfotomaculaceae bacterium]